MTFETVSEATRLWIKGREFLVARLLGDSYKGQAERYNGGALDDYTWQFKAEKFAKMLSPKIRKTLLKAHEVDTLDDYETFAIDNVNTNDVLTPSFPKSTFKREHYPPLCDFLKECVAVCQKSLGKKRCCWSSGFQARRRGERITGSLVLCSAAAGNSSSTFIAPLALALLT
jgi:hypothetical protein